MKDLSPDCLLYTSLWESSLMEKQETTVVVQPSSEAEYQGMAHGSCELLWLKYCCKSWNSKEVDHDLHCTVLLPFILLPIQCM